MLNQTSIGCLSITLTWIVDTVRSETNLLVRLQAQVGYIVFLCTQLISPTHASPATISKIHPLPASINHILSWSGGQGLWWLPDWPVEGRGRGLPAKLICLEYSTMSYYTLASLQFWLSCVEGTHINLESWNLVPETSPSLVFIY